MNHFNHQAALLQWLDERDKDYNHEICMLRSPFSSPGYHTQIKQADTIHMTNMAAIYALALLDSGRSADLARACDVLNQLTALQDQDPTSATFGIWSWFYEEPLSEMAPPDWNWADFIGKQLALVLKRHAGRLATAVRERVTTALSCACDAIIIRDVGPHYTNIAIMGAFVTMCAGEVLQREDYRSYGLTRLGKVREHVGQLQAFQEYNSPPYALITIVELSRIRAHIASPIAQQHADELLEIAWKSVAAHYHAASGQWAGPHSRCYSTLLTKETKAFLQLATEGEIVFFATQSLPYDAQWYDCGITCPKQWRPVFVEPRTEVLQQRYAVDRRWGDKTAYTWMTPTYTLGSFSKEILWNQTRPLLLYVDNGGEATSVQLRCLHDGYDYCSAVFNGAQQEGSLLYGVEFITDGGDTHPNLDFVVDGTIAAADLRLRLEIGGCLARVKVEITGTQAVVRIGQWALRLDNWLSAFGDEDHQMSAEVWETSQVAETTRYGVQDLIALDWVLYKGERRDLDFRTLSQAAAIFTLHVEQSDSLSETSVSPRIEQSGAHVRATLTAQDTEAARHIDLRLHHRNT